MGFTTVIFLCVFFPIIVIAMSLCAHFNSVKLKKAFIICSSLIFYSFSGLYSLVMVCFLTILTYCFYYLSNKGTSKNKWLITGVFVCLFALIIFKYTNFLSINLVALLGIVGINIDFKLPDILMPAGISFIIFSMISFLMDEYKSSRLNKISFFEYSSYIFMFPKVIEGPIAAYDEVSDGISELNLSSERIYEGVRRFMIGFSKKVILADTLAELVAKTFDGNVHAAGYAWLGLVAYALQLFFDFSGYTDMAIGLGQICGFNLPENFRDPYLAIGIQDFWRRWHITLSVWFKKYIYFPLGGSRAGKWKTYRNLLIIFTLTGIWHGANWTFLAWGLWHGLFMLIERIGFSKVLKKMPRFFAHVYTLTVILFGWILFRSDSFANAVVYLKSMFGSASYAEANIIQLLNMHLIFVLMIGGLISFRIPEKIIGNLVERIPSYAKNIFILIVFVLAISYMVSNGYSPSIYTKF